MEWETGRTTPCWDASEHGRVHPFTSCEPRPHLGNALGDDGLHTIDARSYDVESDLDVTSTLGAMRATAWTPGGLQKHGYYSQPHGDTCHCRREVKFSRVSKQGEQHRKNENEKYLAGKRGVGSDVVWVALRKHSGHGDSHHHVRELGDCSRRLDVAVVPGHEWDAPA